MLAVVVVLSWWAKAVCIDGEPGMWGTTRWCYSDIRILWSFRGFDVDAVPYAGPPAGYVEDYTFEYPPGLGFGAWLVGLATDSRGSFFALTGMTIVVCLGAVFVACAHLLRREGASPWWLFGLALSPAVLLFTFQNWDWWAVAPAVLGIWAGHRGRLTEAGLWLGLGIGMKWWPGLLVLVLVLGPWARSDAGLRERLRPLAVTVGTAALLQVPAIAVSPRGWLDAHLFHAERTTNVESGLLFVQSRLAEWFPVTVFGDGFWNDGFWTLVSVATTAGLVIGLVIIGRRLHAAADPSRYSQTTESGRAGVTQRAPLAPLDAALAIVVLFLLTSRIASPQFLLWLVPFAVIARASWLPVLAAELLNALNWLLYGPVLAGTLPDLLPASQLAGLARRAALAWLLYDLLRRRTRNAPSIPSPANASPPPVAGSGAGAGSGVGSGVGSGAGAGAG